MTWLKKYWWIVTIVPAIFVVLFYVFKFILVYIRTDIGNADLSDLEDERKDDINNINKDEKAELDRINKEKEDMHRKIDEGSSTPADVFNKEIEDD